MGEGPVRRDLTRADLLDRLVAESYRPISVYEWPAVAPSKPRDPWDDLFDLLVEFEAQALPHGPYDDVEEEVWEAGTGMSGVCR